MPLIKLNIRENIHLTNNLDELESRIINATENILKKNRQVTVLEIEQSTVRNSTQGAKSEFSMEIYITKGTNSQEQKESWIREIYDIFNSYFGERLSRKVNYISIIELDNTNWGYNGISQKSRKDVKNDI